MDLRKLHAANLPQVLEVQSDAYREELLEAGQTFSRLLAIFPRGCLGTFLEDHLVS